MDRYLSGPSAEPVHWDQSEVFVFYFEGRAQIDDIPFSHPTLSPPKTGSTRLQKQAITRTPSSLFISHFSFPSPCKNMYGLGLGGVVRAEAAAACSRGAQMEGLPWCEMNEKRQTQRRPAGAENTERNLLCRLSAGCKLRPRFCVAISGREVDSGKFQTMQSTLLVVYCQGSERAH